MPDAVSGKAGIVVAFVFPPANVAALQIAAQRVGGDGEERAQQAAFIVAGGHAAKGGPAGAAQQAQKHVFLGVAEVVPQRNPVGLKALPFVFQRRIPQTARGFFHAFALTAMAGNVHGDDAAGDIQAFADGGGVPGVFGGAGAQPMIDGQRP